MLGIISHQMLNKVWCVATRNSSDLFGERAHGELLPHAAHEGRISSLHATWQQRRKDFKFQGQLFKVAWLCLEWRSSLLSTVLYCTYCAV